MKGRQARHGPRHRKKATQHRRGSSHTKNEGAQNEEDADAAEDHQQQPDEGDAKSARLSIHGRQSFSDMLNPEGDDAEVDPEVMNRQAERLREHRYQRQLSMQRKREAANMKDQVAAVSKEWRELHGSDLSDHACRCTMFCQTLCANRC